MFEAAPGSTLVLHSPLKLDDHDFARKVVEEWLGVDWNSLQQSVAACGSCRAQTIAVAADHITPTAAMLARTPRS